MNMPASFLPRLAVALGALTVVFGNATAVADSSIGHAIASWCHQQCHHELARTLIIDRYVPPVCGRCLGIYAGLAAGALAGRPHLPLLAPIAVTLVFAIEVAVEHHWRLDPGNVARFAFGLMFGAAVALRLFATTVRG